MAKLMVASRGDPSGRLLVAVHGRSEDEQDALRISEHFDPDGHWFTLAPRAPSRVSGGYSWFPTWGERTARVTLGQLRKAIVTACEERGREWPEDACLLGFSEGAAAVLLLAYREPPLPVAGVISIGGFQPREAPLGGEPPLPPALLIHGTNDPTISAEEGDDLAATLVGLGASVTRLRFEGEHHVPPEVLPQARAWADGLGSRKRGVG